MADPATRVVASFLQDARADLQFVEFGIQTGNRLGVVHLHQAAEKLVKAIRLSRGLFNTKDHDLELLVDGADRLVGLPEADPWRQKLRELFWLTEYATAYRYPTPTGRLKDPPTAAKQRAALELITRLLVEADQENPS